MDNFKKYMSLDKLSFEIDNKSSNCLQLEIQAKYIGQTLYNYNWECLKTKDL